jgi:hypothetical protein
VKTFAYRFATPVVTGLFLVSGISGIALFFHWKPGLFHSMHEWLSMLLLVPFALHTWRNWNALAGYFHRKALMPAIAASCLAALAFAMPSLNGAQGGNPSARTLPLLTHASLADLAPILRTTPDELAASLRQRGLSVASNADTLDAVAARASTPANQLLLALLPPPNPRN